MDRSASNRQIAKNTMFLYMRMLVSIAVNLYTLRLLWKVLGVDNYGIYNVVGGIVLMFAFLNNAMVASSQRFISFALGKSDEEHIRKTFSMSVTVHALLVVVVFVLAETAGLWFLNYKLNIPAGRMVAANWVYQCSILSFLLTIMSVPYNASIVAHEHMKVYGYLGILDVFMKLGLVLLVDVLPFDPLIAYAVLVLAASSVMRFIYAAYCRRHFAECRYRRFKDPHVLKDMFSFAGWSFIGGMGFSVRDQGMNIILNMFFNVSVNAAKGIANHVGTVINGFSSNFTMALNPQLTKRYAAGDIPEMMKLLYNGCKFSLILMAVIVIPILFSAPAVLHLWLGDVAPYTAGFLQLVLVMALVDCVVSPITTSLQATGRIRKFQIVISLIMIANLPAAWIWLKFDSNPYIVMFVAIATSVIGLGARLMLLHEMIDFSYRRFVTTVYARTVPFILLTGAIAWWIYPHFQESIVGMIGFYLAVWGVCLVLLWTLVLKAPERAMVTKAIMSKIKRGRNAS